MINNKKIGKVVINIIVMGFSITCLFPIIWMLYSSFKTDAEFSMSILKLPGSLDFENFRVAIEKGNMGLFFVNSAINCIVAISITLFLSFTTGYILSRFNFKGKNIIYVFFLSGVIVPIYALLVPIFIEFQTLGLYNKRYTLFLPYIAFSLPMAIFLIDSYMKGIPKALEEAAILDGCNFVQTLSRVILPICTPIISTVTILSFLGNWNEFPLALVLLADQKYKTIPIGLTFFSGEHTVEYPQLFAALSIASVPVIIVYLIFNKQVIKGMVGGSVKG